MRQKDSEKARQIENAIDGYYRENRQVPSLRQIEEVTGISRQTVARYLREMDERGILRYNGRGGTMTRYIDRVTASVSTVRLPIVGQIACGEPSSEEARTEGYVDFPISLLGNGDYFLLRASGDSMTGAGVEDGDLVVIRRTDTARKGEIVAAIDNEGQTTLKRLCYDSGRQRLYLHPENKAYPDLYPSEIRIQGVGVKVIRNLQ